MFRCIEKIRNFEKLNDLFSTSAAASNEVIEKFNKITSEDISKINDKLNSFNINNLIDVLTLRQNYKNNMKL